MQGKTLAAQVGSHWGRGGGLKQGGGLDACKEQVALTSWNNPLVDDGNLIEIEKLKDQLLNTFI